MTTCLVDVNVWVAIASDQHIHSASARNWLNSVVSDPIAFCRIAELGLLRLLTNRRVMGEGTFDTAQAWQMYDTMRADPRVIFLKERAGFSEFWRQAGEKIHGGPNAWTDTYIAAFALFANATVVTFDRGFVAESGCRVITLTN